jgi:hypothetical protein
MSRAGRECLHRRTLTSSVPGVARLRLPRLRERPINASGASPPPLETEEAERSNGAPRTATLAPPAPPPPQPPEETELEPLPPLSLFSKVMLVVVPLALVGVGLYLFGVFDSAESENPTGPAPQIQGTGAEGTGPARASDATDLGFPAFATKNTTRIGGSSAAANAAGAALATFPSTVPDDSPDAVALVPDGDWQGGIATAALMAAPVRAPLLFSGPGGVPSATSEALAAMDPQGSNKTDDVELFALPGADVPGGYETKVLKGSDPAEVAARLAGLRAKLAEGPPEHVLVTSQRDSGIAVPAAAWAARSGDPVLFTGPQGLPKPTAKMLAKFKDVPVYILGPTSAIPTSVENEIADISSQVTRISGEEPVANAINFARFSDGSFGWNVNDPGHGFVIARSNRPLDAVAVAPLSGAGTWGPLLLTDNAATLPGTLRSYLLDVKPGYTADPTRAFYNHVWVIGDLEAISVNEQAAIDYATELGKVEAGGAAE